MGYYTYYSGEISINPPLTKPEYLRLLTVCYFWNTEDELKKAAADVFDAQTPQLTDADKQLQESVEENYGLSFDLDPRGITCPDDRVKGYENEHNLPIVGQWLEQNGHTWDGSIAWDGEESGDTGTIYAATVEGKNRVEFVQDIHENPGPSWSKLAVATCAAFALLFGTVHAATKYYCKATHISPGAVAISCLNGGDPTIVPALGRIEDGVVIVSCGRP